jgi:hypothetical protein
MPENREKKALMKIMEMLFEGKRIILEPDWSTPYTLIIEQEGEKGSKTIDHTHASIFYEEKSDKALEGYVESFVTHILKDKTGLSFHVATSDGLTKKQKAFISHYHLQKGEKPKESRVLKKKCTDEFFNLVKKDLKHFEMRILDPDEYINLHYYNEIELTDIKTDEKLVVDILQLTTIRRLTEFYSINEIENNPIVIFEIKLKEGDNSEK